MTTRTHLFLIMAKLTKSARSAHCVPKELEGFTFKAVIDFIEIELTLATPSQWHHVKRRAREIWGKLYVDSLESKESSKKFRLRVQDPCHADKFMRQLQTLTRKGESLTEDSVKITGLELAIDARHPSNDPEILARAALYLMRHQANLPKGLPRITVPAYFDSPILAAQYSVTKAAHAVAIEKAIYDGRDPPPPLPKKYGSHSVVGSNTEALAALRRGLSINQGKAPHDESGQRGDSYRARYYVKTKDTIDDVSYATLSPAKYSARIERTWQDDAMPFTTIDQWRNFRFETLSRHFELVKPNEPATPLAGLLRERQTQFGRPLDDSGNAKRPEEAIAKSKEPGYRHKKHLGFMADTTVNAMIKTAMKCLTLHGRVKIQKVSGSTNPILSEVERDLDAQSPKYSSTFSNTKAGLPTGSKLQVSDQSPMTSTKSAHSSAPHLAQVVELDMPEQRQSRQPPNQGGPPA